MTFMAIANLNELFDGYIREVRVSGRSLVLIQDQGAHYLIENRCPHLDAPLSTGSLKNGLIICRAHGIGFALESGKAQGPLAGALDCLLKIPLIYQDNKIGLDITA